MGVFQCSLNYRGILCLESSVAWGFYTVGLFLFLHNIVVNIVDQIPVMAGRIAGSILLGIYLVDFSAAMYREKKDDLPDKVLEWKENLISRFMGEGEE